MRTCCIPIITLLHRSQNGQASHWLSLSCLPHNSTSNAFRSDDSPAAPTSHSSHADMLSQLSVKLL